MRRELDLKRRLHSLESLSEAVGAMKSLSAHHYRDVRKAVEPARVYREGIQRLAAWAGAELAAGAGGAGLLVIGAEVGLCGGYNAHVIDLGARQRAELGKGPTFCVGRRAAALLARLGPDVDRTYSGPAGVDGVTGLLLKLAEDMLTTYAGEGLSSFDIVYTPFQGVGATTPRHVRLLPIETVQSTASTSRRR
jgi:F-type H+-transporting ATPase subunit gamma